MSPKLFEYKGISLRFYANDHMPVHVHAIYGNKIKTRTINKTIK